MCFIDFYELVDVSQIRGYLSSIPKVCVDVFVHIVLLHEFQTLAVFYLLECLMCCLRQLCCLCAKFCYPTSRVFVSFKHGAFLATLAEILTSLSIGTSHPVGRSLSVDYIK